MDVLPLIDQLVTECDDPAFAQTVRNAAPLLSAFATRLHEMLAPAPTPSDPWFEDRAAGIPVFVSVLDPERS